MISVIHYFLIATINAAVALNLVPFASRDQARAGDSGQGSNQWCANPSRAIKAFRQAEVASAACAEPVLVDFWGTPGAGEAGQGSTVAHIPGGGLWCAEPRYAIKAFRKAKGSSRGWLGCPGNRTQLVYFHFHEEIVVARFGFRNLDSTKNDPIDIEFVGSNDCKKWTTIKSVRDIAWTGHGEKKCWDIDEWNRGRYTCYGIRALKFAGYNQAGIQDIKMWEGPKLETGAHFAGQGYAWLTSQFPIGSWLIIKLKFKTTSRDGILVAMGDTGPDYLIRPCLVLELHKGILRLRLYSKKETYDPGSYLKRMITAEAHFDDTELTGNQWHTVEARVIRTTVMLIVDGKDGITGYSSDMQSTHRDKIKMYIGGIPDDYRDKWTLFIWEDLSQNNFKGCIKDVTIEEKESLPKNLDFGSTNSIGTRKVAVSGCPIEAGCPA